MNTTPESRCTILYIDDEEKALKYFRMAFAPKFSILTASSGEEGLAMLRKEAGKIGVVVSDQRMPGMIGAEVLGRVREEFPHVVRILTTAYSDLPSAILAVNKGHIYQYVVKPWEVPELEMVLHRAVDYHHVLSERDELLRLKLTTLQRIICCDRVKWLLLTFGEGVPAGAFRKALFALLRSLAAFPPPSQPPEAGFRRDQFDAASLIGEEFHAGVQLKAALEKADESGTVLPLCEPVSRLGERGPLLAATLGAFISSLPGDVSASVATTDGVRVLLSPASPGFVEDLSGILFAAKPHMLSMLLLKILWRFVEADIPLSIELVRAGQEPLRISPAKETVSADEVIEALRGVFEAWDVASR